MVISDKHDDSISEYKKFKYRERDGRSIKM